MAHEFKAKNGLAIQNNTLIREDIGFQQGESASASNRSFAQGNNAVASANNSFAFGDSSNATATEAIQFGAGTNSEANSIQIGSGPRMVSGGAPSSSQDGDIWVDSNVAYVRSNSINVPLGTSQTLAIRSITGATNLAATDGLILAGGTSDYTITLPAANTVTNMVFYIKKTSTASYTLTIDGSGVETIDGSTTIELVSQYDTITIVSDGSNWHII